MQQRRMPVSQAVIELTFGYFHDVQASTQGKSAGSSLFSSIRAATQAPLKA